MKKRALLTNTTCLFAIAVCCAIYAPTCYSQIGGLKYYWPTPAPAPNAASITNTATQDAEKIRQDMNRGFQQQNAISDRAIQQMQQNQARQRAESDAQKAKWDAQSQQSREVWRQTNDKLGQTIRNATNPTSNDTTSGQGGEYGHDGKWRPHPNQPATPPETDSGGSSENQEINQTQVEAMGNTENESAEQARRQEQERQAELQRQEQQRLAELQRRNERTLARYDNAILAVQNQATRAEYEAQVEAVAAGAGSPRENFTNGIIGEVIDKAFPSVGAVSPSMVKDVLEAKDGKEVAGAVATSVAIQVLEQTIPGAGTAIMALTPTETAANDDYSRFYRLQTGNRLMQLLYNKKIMAPDMTIMAPK